jgi:hypothetical protein
MLMIACGDFNIIDGVWISHEIFLEWLFFEYIEYTLRGITYDGMFTLAILHDLFVAKATISFEEANSIILLICFFKLSIDNKVHFLRFLINHINRLIVIIDSFLCSLYKFESIRSW